MNSKEFSVSVPINGNIILCDMHLFRLGQIRFSCVITVHINYRCDTDMESNHIPDKEWVLFLVQSNSIDSSGRFIGREIMFKNA
jgi:hypothetical protein